MDYEELGSLCICRNLFSRNRHIGWVLCAVPEETVSMGQTGSRCGVSPVFTELQSLPEKIRMARVAVEYGSREPGSVTPLEFLAERGS